MITVDADAIVVHYPHMFALMADLQGMAEQVRRWRVLMHAI